MGLNVDQMHLALATQQPALPDQAGEVSKGPLRLLRAIHDHEKSVQCRSPFDALARVTAVGPTSKVVRHRLRFVATRSETFAAHTMRGPIRV